MLRIFVAMTLMAAASVATATVTQAADMTSAAPPADQTAQARTGIEDAMNAILRPIDTVMKPVNDLVQPVTGPVTFSRLMKKAPARL